MNVERENVEQIMEIQRTMKVVKRVARDLLNGRKLEATEPNVEFDKTLQIVVNPNELRVTVFSRLKVTLRTLSELKART